MLMMLRVTSVLVVCVCGCSDGGVVVLWWLVVQLWWKLCINGVVVVV